MILLLVVEGFGLAVSWDVQVPVHIHLYFSPSDELSLFQLILIVRSYVVLLYHCPGLGEGWDPANMFNPATLFMYLPVPSQKPVIQWLSFVYVLHIFFRSFLYINKAVSFLV